MGRKRKKKKTSANQKKKADPMGGGLGGPEGGLDVLAWYAISSLSFVVFPFRYIYIFFLRRYTIQDTGKEQREEKKGGGEGGGEGGFLIFFNCVAFFFVFFTLFSCLSYGYLKMYI